MTRCIEHADVVVIGAGPAGIAAATRAAESSRRIIVLDESPGVGGQIWRHRDIAMLDARARTWIERLRRSGAVIHTRTSVVDVHRASDAFVVTAEREGAPYVVHARTLVLATGARERFLPFPGWTLPGVVGIGGAQALLKSGMPVRDSRVVIAGSGPLLLPVAASLSAHGARVALVAEQAPAASVARFTVGLWRHPSMLLQAARYRAAFVRTPYRLGMWVTAARGTGRVEEVDVSDGATTRTIPCDLLCAAFGLVPSTELARLVGCRVSEGAVAVSDAQETSVADVYCAGESTGVGGVDVALAEGEIAGLSAAARPDCAKALVPQRMHLRAMTKRMDAAFALRDELRSLATRDTIVCRCEDVTLGAIDSRWTSRQAKLYTRAGMGPCQGRVCGTALEFLHGWPADVVRLPAEPALVSTLVADVPDRPEHREQGA